MYVNCLSLRNRSQRTTTPRYNCSVHTPNLCNLHPHTDCLWRLCYCVGENNLPKNNFIRSSAIACKLQDQIETKQKKKIILRVLILFCASYVMHNCMRVSVKKWFRPNKEEKLRIGCIVSCSQPELTDVAYKLSRFVRAQCTLHMMIIVSTNGTKRNKIFLVCRSNLTNCGGKRQLRQRMSPISEYTKRNETKPNSLYRCRCTTIRDTMSTMK